MSSKQTDPSGFGQFVPGFDFLQKLAQGGNASVAGWVAPTLDPEALDKRISELKAVQFWLDQNAAALKATIQALGVQKMTLATLKSMNVPMPGAGMAWPMPGAATAAAPEPKAPPGAKTETAAAAGSASPMGDPMQYWSALTQQFQTIASTAMKDVATRTAAAQAAAQKTSPQAAPAQKAAPRRRKTN
jgi:hypothetical protein